jgi:hypothetical protein
VDQVVRVQRPLKTYNAPPLKEIRVGSKYMETDVYHEQLTLWRITHDDRKANLPETKEEIC